MYEVLFAEGSFTTTVEVPIIDNSIAEGEETFYGSLATVGGANVLVTQNTAEIHIIDNDGMWCKEIPKVQYNSMLGFWGVAQSYGTCLWLVLCCTVEPLKNGLVGDDHCSEAIYRQGTVCPLYGEV